MKSGVEGGEGRDDHDYYQKLKNESSTARKNVEYKNRITFTD